MPTKVPSGAGTCFVKARWQYTFLRIAEKSLSVPEHPLHLGPGDIRYNSRAVKAQYASEVPLGRIAKPEDVASAALFLASDDAAFINGIDLPVDGGSSQL